MKHYQRFHYPSLSAILQCISSEVREIFVFKFIRNITEKMTLGDNINVCNLFE